MKRILIVDDERLIGHTLSALLRRDDTYIKTVECGRDALNEINHIVYQLIFLDVKLPDICGLDLVKDIKKASPDTLIIIMTGGLVYDPKQLQFIQENAHLLISKPFDLDGIKLFVDRFVRDEPSCHSQEGENADGRSGHRLFDNHLLDDKRQLERQRQVIMPSTTCAMVAADDEQGETSFTAGILEISDTGMCIQTECLLKPGQLLRFSDDPVPSTGVVRWSKGGGPEDSYRAGIQFIMPEGQAQ
jgi:DNA-binding response OmpR family regulator